MPVSISVIIPTLNEATSLPATLHGTAGLGFDEVLVVDGGSEDGTREAAAAFGPPVRCLLGPRGRAPQMNAGAGLASGEVLLFLHADTRLPGGARAAIVAAFEHPRTAGGRFDVRFDPERPLGRLIAFMMNRRSRWTGIATGDHAIFVRRQVFRRMGGFRDLPLMEDVDFSRRLKQEGDVAALREAVITSYRRWQRCGPIRTIVQMWMLRLLYWGGINPHRLTRWYPHVR